MLFALEPIQFQPRPKKVGLGKPADGQAAERPEESLCVQTRQLRFEGNFFRVDEQTQTKFQISP